MKKKVESLVIKGVEYVPKDSLPEMAIRDGQDFVLVRSRDSGVHAGYLAEKNGTEVVLNDSIRIWLWKGAATLSQLAMDGPKDPGGCKFGVPLPEITVMGACEIIPCSDDARKIIEGVKSWKR